MTDGFQHEALPYSGPSEFVTSCVDVLEDALERDERLIVLAGAEKIDAVSAALGSTAGDVTLVATDEHGRNPSRITTMLHSFQAAGDGRPSLGVNESVLVGRTSAGRAEVQLSEVLLNNPGIRSWPLSVVCLYDTATLDPDSLESMRQSHPVVRGLTDNPDYRPDLATSLYAGPLDPAPPDPARMVVSSTDLMAMRTFVRATAAAHGLEADRVDDLVLAANEIVTNSLRHGGGVARMTMWFADGAMVCEVSDSGYIQDPLVGRFAPPPAATSGRGVWLANHLCDLVQLRSSPTGTVVRLHVDRL
ncbi:MAG: sensor histidine kinase [Actinomycetota bacterium]|nr:sensor histidine kinase [Actinomycetota bacterium]